MYRVKGCPMVHLGIILTTPFTPQGVVEPSPLSRSGLATATHWHRSVFTLSTQQPCYGNAVASQRLHAVNATSLRLSGIE